MNELLVSLNNDACVLIERGYYDEAFSLLKQAMTCFLSAENQNTQNLLLVNEEDILRNSAMLVTTQCVDTRQRLVGDYVSIQLCYQSFKISRNTSVISDDRRLSSCQAQQEDNLSDKYSDFARLVYNGALAIHLSALEEGVGQCSAKLQRALKQYNLSRELLGHPEVAYTNEWFLLMATLNNQAQINYELCQHNQSRQCLQWLQEVLHTPEGHHNQDSQFDDIIFRLNIVFYKDLQAASPAA